MAKVGIMAYGELDDRKRLERIAAAHNMSGSQWMIMRIRQAYADIYGTTEIDEDETGSAEGAVGHEE